MEALLTCHKELFLYVAFIQLDMLTVYIPGLCQQGSVMLLAVNFQANTPGMDVIRCTRTSLGGKKAEHRMLKSVRGSVVPGCRQTGAT